MGYFDEILRTYGTNPDYDVQITENARKRSAKVTRVSDGKVVVDISQECPKNKLQIRIKPKAAILIFLIAIVVLIYIIGIIFF